MGTLSKTKLRHINQKLKHVVTRYFDTKFTKKSKQIIQQPGPFILIHICFLTKRKNRELANLQPSLNFDGIFLVKRERSLHRNGRTAIPKITSP